LRVSVTQRCNLKCFFCHKEGEKGQRTAEMAPDEIQRIVSVAASFGVDKVKLTGGEPLLREDIVSIVSGIANIKGVKDVAMTTNGILLECLASALKDAGLNRINVSLGSLHRAVYSKIAGVDAVDKVYAGILAAKHAGLDPIKVNMVVLKGVNDTQVWEMLDFTRAADLVLQLIEVESATSEDSYYINYHKDLTELEAELSRRAEKIVVREMQDRKRFFLRGGGEVEIVRPMHNTRFCRNCTRLRVTSDGKLKPCLFRSDNMVDILGAVRRGASDEELREIFRVAVAKREPYFT
ncbi:MAG: GTP 3',8-cyclase MoaA, partial [Nitrososphaerota archaeon]